MARARPASRPARAIDTPQWRSDVPESSRNRLMQPGQVGRARRQPAEVDLETVALAVRHQANRQVRGRISPQDAGPPDALRLALALVAGRRAGAMVAAAQPELDRVHAVHPLVPGDCSAAGEQLPDLARPLRRSPVNLAERAAKLGFLGSWRLVRAAPPHPLGIAHRGLDTLAWPGVDLHAQRGLAGAGNDFHTLERAARPGLYHARADLGRSPVRDGHEQLDALAGLPGVGHRIAGGGEVV